MTRGKGLRTKHLDSEQRFRVRVLFFDAGLTKKRIEEITGYTGSQIRTAISAKSHQVGARSGRPGKEEVRRRNEEQQLQQQQQQQQQQQAALEAGTVGSSSTQANQPQPVPGFAPAPLNTPATYQPLQTQQPVQQDAQSVVNPSEGCIENAGTEGQAQASTLNESGRSPHPSSPSSNNPDVSDRNSAAAASAHSEGSGVQHASPSPSIGSADATDDEQSTPALVSLPTDAPAAAGQSLAEADAITTTMTSV